MQDIGGHHGTRSYITCSITLLLRKEIDLKIIHMTALIASAIILVLLLISLISIYVPQRRSYASLRTWFTHCADGTIYLLAVSLCTFIHWIVGIIALFVTLLIDYIIGRQFYDKISDWVEFEHIAGYILCCIVIIGLGIFMN